MNADWTISQSTFVCTLQSQSSDVLISTLATPPAALINRLVGLREYLQAWAVVVVVEVAGTVDVVGTTVVVGGGASVFSSVNDEKDRGCSGQSRSVAPPVHCRNWAVTGPENWRSAVQVGRSEVSVPRKSPPSGVPSSTPLTLPLLPLGVA